MFSTLLMLSNMLQDPFAQCQALAQVCVFKLP